MNTFLEDCDDWSDERALLSEAEANGNFPHPDEWHGSDDTAVELLRQVHPIIARMADVFGDTMLLDELATKFTCWEADVVADFLAACHGDEFAAEFLNLHIEQDDGGDGPHVRLTGQPCSSCGALYGEMGHSPEPCLAVTETATA